MSREYAKKKKNLYMHYMEGFQQVVGEDDLTCGVVKPLSTVTQLLLNGLIKNWWWFQSLCMGLTTLTSFPPRYLHITSAECQFGSSSEQT